MTAGRRRMLTWFSATLAAILVPTVVVSIRNGAAIRPHIDLQVRFIHYRTGDRPLLAELAGGRIKLGDLIEDVIATHTPDKLVRHGEYVTASYNYGGPHRWDVVILIARNGKLASAKLFTASDNDEFFHDATAVGPDYLASYNDEVGRQSWEAYQFRDAPRLSVAGFGGVYIPGSPGGGSDDPGQEGR